MANKFYSSHGSISRTGAHANDLIRRPCVGFIELTEAGFDTKIVRPKIPPAEDLMDLERRSVVMEEKKQMTEFVNQLKLAKVETSDPRGMLEEVQPEVRIRELVIGYLDKAEAEQ